MNFIQICMAALDGDRVPLTLVGLETPISEHFLGILLLKSLFRISYPKFHSIWVCHENEVKLEKNPNYLTGQIKLCF